MILQKSKAGEESFMVLLEMKVKEENNKAVYIFPTCGLFLDLPYIFQFGNCLCLNKRFIF